MTEARKEVLNPVEGAKVFQGLLWREWLAHGNLVMCFFSIWLVCLWVLLLFFHPTWILCFGLVFALMAGPAFGGRDVAEGVEEFSFSLPPTRAARYLVRVAVGGGILLILTTIGLLAIRLELPQAFWGLFVESGFTEHFPVYEHDFSYALAFAVPFAAFACSFTFASLAHSGHVVGSAWFVGGLGTGAIVSFGYLCEYHLWRKMTGSIVCPLLIVAGAVSLVGGYLAYVRKEGINKPTTLEGRGRWWIWIAAPVALFLLLLLLYWATGVVCGLLRCGRGFGM